MSRRNKKGKGTRRNPSGDGQKATRQENEPGPNDLPFASLKEVKKRLTTPKPGERDACTEPPGQPSSKARGPEVQPSANSGKGIDTEDDLAAFSEAMQGSQRLKRNKPRIVKTHRQPVQNTGLEAINDDTKMLRELGLWIEGKIDFQLAEEAERVQGVVSGLDRRIIRKLRKGEFAIQAHVDLHGLTVKEASTETQNFILNSIRQNLRCILVIHGKGLHSKSDKPVLKNELKRWLTGGTMGRCVLAFTSALPRDGGYGATYVLLRKSAQRGDRKKAILVQE